MTIVRLTKQADRDMMRLDRGVMEKAVQAMGRLKGDPFAGHALSGKLRGARSLEFSAPGGAYRAAYVMDDQDCVVFLVGSHENFYDLAERRLEALRKRD